jgi:ABC-type multidrug transport system ATPase subunit
MDSIRRGTGICPQYNTLFDRLTVEEHMQFYAGLKGKWDGSFEAEFLQMITDLGIPHKRHEFPKNLSGGMKRKLSVACSFIGGSKTVFLDEPTSGVGKRNSGVLLDLRNSKLDTDIIFELCRSIF